MSEVPPFSEPSPMSGAPAFSVGDAVSYGWNALMKNLGPMVLIALVFIAVEAVFGIIANVTSNVGVQIIVRLIGYVIGLVLTLGVFRVTLAVTRGEKPDVGMLFKTDHLGPFVLAAILFSLGFVVGFILLIIPGIIFAIAFGFYGFVILDKDEQSPMEALKASGRITKGHRWQLLGLGLLLLLINLVGLALCCVGVLFTWPIAVLAHAYAYRTLSGEAVAPPA